MGFLNKEKLPKPTDIDKDKQIAELEAELQSIKKTREAEKASMLPNEPLLPPKFDGAGKYVHGEKQPIDEPKIETKIEYVRISDSEAIMIQLEAMQQAILEILERLKR